MRVRFFLAAAISCLSLLVLPRAGWAQDNCLSFRGIYQASYDAVSGGWPGTLYAFLGEKELLIGTIVASEPGSSSHTGVTGHDKDVSVTWAFTGVDGTFTQEQHGTYPMPPGKSGLGYYNGVAKIVSGTGRFQNASGTTTFGGPYLLWPIEPSNPNSALAGRWNAEVSGKICDVQPTTPAL